MTSQIQSLCLSDVTNTEFMFLSNVTNTEQMNYYEMAHTYNNMELTSQAKGLFKLFVCMMKGQDRKCWLNFTPGILNSPYLIPCILELCF